MKMTRPTEHHESNCGHVMNKHLPKILKIANESSVHVHPDLVNLSLHINELGEEQRPIKRQLHHVIPPDR